MSTGSAVGIVRRGRDWATYKRVHALTHADLGESLAVYQRRRVPGAADLARRAREALA
jgi:hypothetical protein